MKLWWMTNIDRMKIEKEAIQKLDDKYDWVDCKDWSVDGHHLVLEAKLYVHKDIYKVKLTYPDHFPYTPPWVEPQDKDSKWSNHQYGKGALCLELRPDNWVISATGADMLRSAYNLLEKEKNLESDDHVPSAHNIGEIQSYGWSSDKIFIGQGCLDRIQKYDSENVSAIKWGRNDKTWPMLISDTIDHLHPQHPPSADISVWRIEVPVFIINSDSPPQTPFQRSDFLKNLDHTLKDQILSDNPILMIIVGNNKAVPYYSTNINSIALQKWIILPDQVGIRSKRKKDTTQKQIVIIGIGSVGSKVAEILLRSGIHNIILIDGDIFLPGNLERHTLDWRDIGFHKSKAVKDRLLNIVPGANILAIEENLNWQRSAKHHANVIELIANSDLIIDTTGDSLSSLMLGALAADNDLPFVSTEIFEGGIGALISRSIPNYDPPYTIGRQRFYEWCEEKNTSPPSSGIKDYESLNRSGNPIIADDTTVTIGAAHTSQVVLDIIEENISNINHAWLLLGCKNEWIFKGHGHNILINTGKNNCYTKIEMSLLLAI